MARNKIEKEFSEKLSQREIKPTEMAWDRLDAMLTVAEQEKPVKKRSWLYIAASFLGFLLVATLFFNKGNDVEIGKPQVVQQEALVTNRASEPLALPKTRGQDALAPESAPNENQPILNKVFQSVSQNQIAQNTTSQNQLQQGQGAESNQSPENHNEITRPGTVNGGSITKADELLAVAQSNSGNGAPIKSVNVNAKGLLSQVDGERSMTFREKLLQKVGKNYQNVKVALANRNIEDENH
ncbi:MAG TPA: hypothetical protein VF676_05515 [Flavobacterium sp.]|jgi:hypothetical protein